MEQGGQPADAPGSLVRQGALGSGDTGALALIHRCTLPLEQLKRLWAETQLELPNPGQGLVAANQQLLEGLSLADVVCRAAGGEMLWDAQLLDHDEAS